jgi:hypothetical protein
MIPPPARLQLTGQCTPHHYPGGRPADPGISAAATVGEALARAGIALQGLDYASPVEDQPVLRMGLSVWCGA